MLGGLRTKGWRRRAMWARGIGILLMLVAFFVPLPPAALVAVLLGGIAVFLFGALAWLVRDPGPWLRRG